MKDMGARQLTDESPKNGFGVSASERPSPDSAGFFEVFMRDVQAFKEQLPKLLKEIPGEYVAILDGKIVDHKPDWNDVFVATRKAHPDLFVLIEHVAPRSAEGIDMDTLDR
jgi:hypothetical protein